MIWKLLFLAPNTDGNIGPSRRIGRFRRHILPLSDHLIRPFNIDAVLRLECALLKLQVDHLAHIHFALPVFVDLVFETQVQRFVVS